MSSKEEKKGSGEESKSSNARERRVSYQHLPAHEREEIRRRRNAESAQRSRARKKMEGADLEKALQENDERIKDLEKVAAALESELGSSSKTPKHGDDQSGNK